MLATAMTAETAQWLQAEGKIHVIEPYDHWFGQMEPLYNTMKLTVGWIERHTAFQNRIAEACRYNRSQFVKIMDRLCRC